MSVYEAAASLRTTNNTLKSCNSLLGEIKDFLETLPEDQTKDLLEKIQIANGMSEFILADNKSILASSRGVY